MSHQNSSVPQDPDFIQQTLSKIHLAAAVLGITNSISIIATNLLVTITILSSSRLRLELRNILIVSTAVSDLLVGVFGCPLKTDYVLRGDWGHSCYTHVTVQVVMLYGELCIVMWNLVIINVDWVLRNALESPVWFTLFQLRLLKSFLVALPWASLFLLVVPVIFEGLHREFVLGMWTDSFCPLWLRFWSRGILHVFTFFLPAVSLIITNIVSALRTRHYKKPSDIETLVGLKSNPERLSKHVIINILVVAIILPDQIFRFLVYFKNLTFSMNNLAVLYGLSCLADARSGILPILWLLLMPDLKQQLNWLVKRGFRWRTERVVNDRIVSYRNDLDEKFIKDEVVY